MKISVFSPMKNEVSWVGYSIMSVLPHVHEILYACAESNDGTDELLKHIKDKYAGDKLKLFYSKAFDITSLSQKEYEGVYDYLISGATGDVVWFLHADMICTNPEKIKDIPEDPIAWWTTMKSFAGDMNTIFSKGRSPRWKHLYRKQFGLHYHGAYGAKAEDLYFGEITGNQYSFKGNKIEDYPYDVGDSGLTVNHYCEVEPYKERLTKMRLCLKNQYPEAGKAWIDEISLIHPRVILESTSSTFGTFEFKKINDPIPEVFEKYRSEFEVFKTSKEKELIHG